MLMTYVSIRIICANAYTLIWLYSTTVFSIIMITVLYSQVTYLPIHTIHNHTPCSQSINTLGHIYLIFHRQMQNIYWYNYIIHIYNLSTTQTMHVYAIIIVSILANSAYISPNVFINIAIKILVILYNCKPIKIIGITQTIQNMAHLLHVNIVPLYDYVVTYLI